MIRGKIPSYSDSILILAATGLLTSFILLFHYHANPFRIPVFADIPVCYIYGNVYLAILAAYLMKPSSLTKILAVFGILSGFLVSLYFLLLYTKFPARGYIFTAEICGIKTVFIDHAIFLLILLNVLFRRKKKTNN